MGYFGPGELPKFDSEFFDNPEGTTEQKVMADFKAKMEEGRVPEGPEGDKAWKEFTSKLQDAISGPSDATDVIYSSDKDNAVF